MSAAERIDKRLGSVQYPDAQAAIEDAARLALFVAVPEAERAHAVARRAEEARVAAPRTTPAGPSAASATSARRPTMLHEVGLLAALLAGLVAFALVVPSPRTGRSAFALDDGVIWSGVLVAVTFGIYLWAEPVRRSTRMYAWRGAATGLLLFMPILWLALLAFIARQWDDVDEPGLVVIGVVLVVVSTVGMVLLWWRARGRRDIPPPVVLSPQQRDEVAEAMDRWWSGISSSLTQDERTQIAAAYGEAVARLVERGQIPDGRAATALRTPPATIWREERV